jgi:hypothetical protein
MVANGAHQSDGLLVVIAHSPRRDDWGVTSEPPLSILQQPTHYCRLILYGPRT